MKNTLPSISMEGFRPKLAGKAKGSSRKYWRLSLAFQTITVFLTKEHPKMRFFVFSFNFAWTREGWPTRRTLTERLVKSKKSWLVTDPAAICFVFQVKISCKTPSIILYFKYASYSVVTRKKRQNTNPHPDENFCVDRFGTGNRPFYSCVLCDLAFEWKWGWRWPCFDTNPPAFHG